VVSLTRLEAIKAIETEDDDSAVHDSEQLKARATQRVEDLVRGGKAQCLGYPPSAYTR
jgi:general secretion pathway protein E